MADGRRCARPGGGSGWGAQTDSTGPYLSAPTYLFGETGIINSKGLAQIISQQLFQVRNPDSSPSRENSRGSRTREGGRRFKEATENMAETTGLRHEGCSRPHKPLDVFVLVFLSLWDLSALSRD